MLYYVLIHLTAYVFTHGCNDLVMLAKLITTTAKGITKLYLLFDTAADGTNHVEVKSG